MHRHGIGELMTIITLVLSLSALAATVFLLETILITPVTATDLNQPLQDGQRIKLWPGAAPGSENLSLKEEVVERSKEPSKIKDRYAWKIIDPALTVYLPEKPNGAGILVFPGGGYQRVVFDKEGEDLAPWLNSLGVTFFVLRYRLPGEGHRSGADAPLQDAQRAIRLIRKNAPAWGLDPERLGVMGFSAGGHLASSLGIKYNQVLYRPIDDIDAVNARPDFLILGYPVITMRDPYVHPGSRTQLLGSQPTPEQIDAYSNELLITKDTPQTFIMHASDDAAVPVENSINFYLGLRRARVPVEMHLFKDGGHGYSIRSTYGKTCEQWPLLCGQWLKSIGIIK